MMLQIQEAPWGQPRSKAGRSTKHQTANGRLRDIKKQAENRDYLEKEMVSTPLLPGKSHGEEPGGLQSMVMKSRKQLSG